MEHWERIRLANQPGVKIEIEIQAAICLALINGARHQQVARVMVALRLNQSRIEIRKRRVLLLQRGGKNLKFLATPALSVRL